VCRPPNSFSHASRCVYSTLQYDTKRYSTLQYATVRYRTLQYATVRYRTLQYATVRYNTLQYDTERYSTLQNATVRYSTIQNATAHSAMALYFRLRRQEEHPRPTVQAFTYAVGSRNGEQEIHFVSTARGPRRLFKEEVASLFWRSSLAVRTVQEVPVHTLLIP
jgi:hypothetical protein